MVIFFSILLLVITSIALLLLRFFRQDFNYYWLISVFVVGISWVTSLFAWIQIPSQIVVVDWSVTELLGELPVSFSPTFLLDGVSWTLSVSLIALALAVVLSDVQQAFAAHWSNWVGVLSLAAFGTLGILAGNLLTMLMLWAVIDALELVILLKRIEDQDVIEREIIAISTRIVGIMFVLWGDIVARVSGEILTFDNIPLQSSVYLLLGSGARLGVFPTKKPFLKEKSLQRGLGSMIQLVPVATSLMLIVRTGFVGIAQNLAPSLILITALLGIAGSIQWAIADNEIQGRPYWILGWASLVIVSAIRAQPISALAWGEILLLGGGLSFLYAARANWLIILPLVGLFNLTGFPYSASWSVASFYSGNFNPVFIVFWMIQGILMTGFVIHAIRPGPPLSRTYRGIKLVYFLGLAVLPATHYIFGVWRMLRSGSHQYDWLGASLPLGILLMVFLGRSVLPQETRDLISSITRQFRVFSLRWFFQFILSIYNVLRRWVDFLTLLLEGEGGFLWTLLLLILLLSIFSQIGFGGG